MHNLGHLMIDPAERIPLTSDSLSTLRSLAQEFDIPVGLVIRHHRPPDPKITTSADVVASDRAEIASQPDELPPDGKLILLYEPAP
jgi:hypothetical protein